jgi:hypothetical protein
VLFLPKITHFVYKEYYMKRLILILAVVLSGCATKTMTPIAPSDFTSYRKNVEVLVIGCQKDESARATRSSHKAGVITLVESTTTGERFNVHGCMGRAGDRIKIAY